MVDFLFKSSGKVDFLSKSRSKGWLSFQIKKQWLISFYIFLHRTSSMEESPWSEIWWIAWAKFETLKTFRRMNIVALITYLFGQLICNLEKCHCTYLDFALYSKQIITQKLINHVQLLQIACCCGSCGKWMEALEIEPRFFDWNINLASGVINYYSLSAPF